MVRDIIEMYNFCDNILNTVLTLHTVFNSKFPLGKPSKKSVDFFHTSWTHTPPSPKVWKIFSNFAAKKGLKKRAKCAKKHTFEKVWVWTNPPPLV